MIIVKVGGSLYDHPRFVPGLRSFLATLDPEPVLLVPGGGPVTDAVRHLDAIHRLGEENAHWLALRSLDVTAEFLRWVVLPFGPRLTVLDCYVFAVEDEAHPGALPHSWAVTSDSVAARVAVVHGAARMILLKSVDVPPGTPWPEAAANGWVDPHFPHVIPGVTATVEAINFRRWLENPSRPT